MNWVIFWQAALAMLVLSFLMLIFYAMASAASAARHKRKLELIEARRLNVQITESSVTVNADGNQDPRMVAESALRAYNERSL